MNQPASISPRSSSSQNQTEDQHQLQLESILKSQHETSMQHQATQQQQLQQQQQNNNLIEMDDTGNDDLDEIQLEMLIEECEELINKISPGCNPYYIHDETLLSEQQETFSMKHEKNRLEKEHIELCLEIERQQKELQNYRFKVQVAHKEAEYYGRQIKEKSAILQSLESHEKNKKVLVKKR